LKHIERTRLIAHLIDTSDASDRDPVHDFEIIEGELAAFSEKLAEKPMIVVATKLDATTERARLEKLREFCASRGLEFHAVSSASGEGIPQLVRAMADALDRLAPPEPLIEPAGEGAGDHDPTAHEQAAHQQTLVEQHESESPETEAPQPAPPAAAAPKSPRKRARAVAARRKEGR
jgi:GTPase involved in cell partitioning and DNA repair